MELKKLKLKKLFLDTPVQIYGNKELEVTGLSSHSKLVSMGHLFIARSGLKTSGANYIQEAIEGGATAVLTDLYDPFLKNVVQVVHPDPKSLEGLLAKRFYGIEKGDLTIIGITGTNGKTTTSYLLRQLLGPEQTGLIGTIEYLIGEKSIPASLTTPDVISNHKMLSRMKKSHLKYALMEVTSHALTQNRVDYIPFDFAGFTNLTQDHLDYHPTMQAYAEAKAKLFEKLSSDQVAFINSDSPYAKHMTKNCKAIIKTYGLSPEANFYAKGLVYHSDATQFELQFNGQSESIKTPLVGQFNVYNTLLAIAMALEVGLPFSLIKDRLETIHAPSGRLQPIENDLGIQVFVDFAHTEDALRNVLMTLKELPHQRLICVFGCGGDRDPEKRPLMGEVVSQFSDLTFITSDNPRSEDPLAICEAIKKGCDPTKEVMITVDRKRAINQALNEAQSMDIVLIAGRGHEPYQLIKNQRIPFQDAAVAKECLNLLNKTTTI